MPRLRVVVVVLLLAVSLPLLAKDKKKDKGLPKFIAATSSLSAAEYLAS